MTLKFDWKELDYGPYIEVHAETPQMKFEEWDGRDDMHPFWATYCTFRHPSQSRQEADEQGYEPFEIKEDLFVLEEIVADNQVTRAIIGAIENIDGIEVGNTLRSAYLSNLIDILFNRLWD